MVRVVYNRCYGGFSLSREACERYWELQGKQVWIENSSWGVNVWLVPPKERLKYPKDWYSLPLEERIAFNEQYSKQTWYVVEELGEKASGDCAKLAIAEVSGPYRIDEYDGYETVKQPDGYDWITP